MSFFVDLAPEFGGTRYGPFASMVRVGSDPNQCEIVLSAAMGIRPLHATITLMKDGLALHAGEIGASVHLLRGGQSTQVQGGQWIQIGDVVALGSPDGLRLRIGQSTPGQAASTSVPGPAQRARGRRPPTANAMASEVKRQLGTSVMTSGAGAQAGHFIHQLQSGALFQPRYLVAGLLTLMGGLLTLCSGAAALILSQLR